MENQEKFTSTMFVIIKSAIEKLETQAVSYTTGVPAMIGSKLLYKGVWKNKGVFNIEEFDAKPFMDELMTQGLPWKIFELDVK